MPKAPGKVLFLWLDAFRHDYINEVDTPFLNSKLTQGVYGRKLRSMAGFAQRTAMFCGTTGLDTDAFTMFTFDSEDSPYSFLRSDERFAYFTQDQHWWDWLPAIRGSLRLKSYLQTRFLKDREAYRHWVREEARKRANLPVMYIPLELLPELGVSEDKTPIHEPGGCPVESIFDVFVEAGVPYEYLMYPVVNVQDDAVLDAFLAHAESPSRVLIGQFAESDFLVHQCGPDAPARRKVMGEIDRKLRLLHERFPADTTWVIAGDHGMTEVVEEIDVPAELESLEQELSVRMGRDYLLFLDSTMARFRSVTEQGARFLEAVRQHETLRQKGQFIESELATKHSIPIHNRTYGDVIWWANAGVLLFPDYFHDEQTHNKGMHGYDSDHIDMKSFFLAFGPGITPTVHENVSLLDVCPTLCTVAGVRPPRNNQGKCLLSPGGKHSA